MSMPIRPDNRYFQDLVRHCISRKGKWTLLLVFVRMQDARSCEPEKASVGVRSLFHPRLNVLKTMTFDHVLFAADEHDPTWNSVAAVPVFRLGSEAEEERLVAEMETNLRLNPAALAVSDLHGQRIDNQDGWKAGQEYGATH